MGSRRGRHAALTRGALALAACTSGPPPGFSGATDDRWALPLVGPLEGGVLVTPVTISGVGPFLFAIDPDAAVSIVDAELLELASLRTGPGPKRVDETDTNQTRQYAELRNVEVPPVARRLVDASLGDTKVAMHLDLGASASALRESVWERAKLVARDVRVVTVDEAGSARQVTRATEPARVTVGPHAGDAVFLPYADARWPEHEIDGALGLDVFRDRDVWASWHRKTLWLVPRTDVPPQQRIARWDSAVFARCKHVGCVEVRVIDPLAGKPPPEGRRHPGLVLSITRDPIAGGMPLEAVLEARGPGERLPLLVANMPPHVDRLIHQLKPQFLGAALAVVDASPYPRTCPGPNGCVDTLAR